MLCRSARIVICGVAGMTSILVLFLVCAAAQAPSVPMMLSPLQSAGSLLPEANMAALAHARDDDAKIDPGNGPKLHPGSNAYVVLYEAFLDSGWSPEESLDHAAAALGLPQEGVAGAEHCYTSTLTVVYCDENELPVRWSGFLNGSCVGDLEGCLMVYPKCPTGQSIYHKLNLKNNCGDLPNGCVAVKWGAPQWHPCFPDDTLHCTCFEETDPLECEDIEFGCCPTGGCLCDAINCG